MTDRQRFLDTLLFRQPDRIPLQPGRPRESTLAAWRTQGLPQDEDWYESLMQELGIDYTPATPPATLTRARRIAMKNGVRYAYTGNVVDPEGDATLCHQCGHLLIGRNWYTMTTWNVSPELGCPSCGTPCAGVLEPRPGTWGAKRQPVRIGG